MYLSNVTIYKEKINKYLPVEKDILVVLESLDAFEKTNEEIDYLVLNDCFSLSGGCENLENSVGEIVKVQIEGDRGRSCKITELFKKPMSKIGDRVSFNIELEIVD